uniref:RRM domain-containing protein n=1 Tax=Oryza rufipogon TaxID=4529 RepID=A0A0E0PKD5_ORYRU
MAPPRIRGKLKRISQFNSAKTGRKKKISKKRPAQQEPERRLGMIRFRIMACAKSPEQDICYICGDDDHMEHFCPYNYMFGRYFSDTCRGECPPQEHRITSWDHREFLRRFVRVTNLPPGFGVWDLEDLFSPFGALLMWNVPKFRNYLCGCTTGIHMSFGFVVFKRREDGERAVDELNGYQAGDRRLRVDWGWQQGRAGLGWIAPAPDPIKEVG